MLIVATLVFGALAVLGGGQAFADTSTSNNANTLKISPLRTDLTITPGKTGKVTVKVTNLTKAPMTIQAIENDFIAGDENGTPALILDANKYAPTHSLKRYMVPLQNITIPAGKIQNVTVTIKVPADAKPGGYFGAIRFTPAAAAGGQSVNLNASAASLILMTVPGNAVEKLALTSFDITQGSKTNGLFQSANDLHVVSRFENTGDVQEGPFGNITVTQGKKIVYSYKFNNAEPRDMILPDSARRWDVPLKNIGSFGHYTVTATFTYGASNQTINVTKSFWVIPWTVIIAAVVGVLVLIGLIVGVWLFLRNYKRRVLRSNSRRSGPRR